MGRTYHNLRRAIVVSDSLRPFVARNGPLVGRMRPFLK